MLASSVGAGRVRTVGWVVGAAAVLVLVVDGGSVGLTKMMVGDDAKEAARNAAKAVTNQPINPVTAVVAYDAATEVTQESEDVAILKNPPGETEDFRVGPDGSVRLTLEKQAPTLVWKHLPKLGDYTTVRVTYEHDAVGY